MYLRALADEARNARPNAQRRAALRADGLEVRMFNVDHGEAVLLVFPGGRAWQSFTADLPSSTVLRVRIVRDFPSIVWATTPAGVARSNDGGRTWTDVSGDAEKSGLPAVNLQALAVWPDDPDVALVATDTFVFSVRSSDRFLRGRYHAQGIYRTEDGGETWTRSDEGIFADEIEFIETNPVRPYEVWAAQQASRGVYRSSDAAQSWSLSPGLLTHYPMRLAFFPDDPDRLAVTSLHMNEDFGISANSGVDWTVLSEQTFFDSLNRGRALFDAVLSRRGNLHLHGLAIHPENSDVMLVGSVADPTSFNAKPLKGAHIFRSTDGGISRQESDQGFDHAALTSIHDIKFDPRDPDTVWIATSKHEATSGNGLWVSGDGGQTWRRSNAGMPNDTSAMAIVIHPQRPGLLVAATLRGIYRSADGGDSWSLVDPAETSDVKPDLAQPDILYAGTAQGVLLSSDFGLTWEDVSANLPAATDASRGRPGGPVRQPAAVTSIGVNCNGTVVYAGVQGYGCWSAWPPRWRKYSPTRRSALSTGSRGLAVREDRQAALGRRAEDPPGYRRIPVRATRAVARRRRISRWHWRAHAARIAPQPRGRSAPAVSGSARWKASSSIQALFGYFWFRSVSPISPIFTGWLDPG